MRAIQCVVWILLLAGVSSLGCGGCDEKPHETKPEPTVSEADVGQDVAVPELTLESLNPIFRTTGVEASGVSVEFAYPILNTPGAAKSGTVLRVTQNGEEVAGSSVFTSVTTLQFAASTAFKPGTEYTVELFSVEGETATFAPEKPWVYTFRTPEFAFLQLSDVVATGDAGMSVVLVFSGPVQMQSLEKRLSWKLGGKPIGKATLQQGLEASIIVASWAKVRPSDGDILEVVVSEGVTHREFADVSAKAGQSQAAYVQGPEVSILGFERKESQSGHYIHVICNDTSAPGGERWYWDRTSYNDYEVSSRCLPKTSNLARTILIHPTVPNLKVSAGEAGFNLLGDFSRGTYTIRVLTGMQTTDGGVVTQTTERTITVPQRTPSLKFPVKGRYLPRAFWKRIPFSHLNTPQVDVVVRHVPTENLVFWMSGEEVADQRTSNIVARKTLTLDGAADQATAGNLDVATMLPQPAPGLYEVTVSSNNARDAVRVLLTDINLIIKQSQAPEDGVSESYTAWALDMRTAEPLQGVQVNLIRQSGQVVTGCVTDASGGCGLSMGGSHLDPTAPFAVMARKGDDVTFLKFDELKASTEDADVHGESYFGSSAYRVFAYGDRDVYRPGETVHLVAAVRGQDYVAPKAGLPVDVVFKDSRGRTVQTQSLKTNGEGVVSTQLRLQDFASTGTYRAALKIAKRDVGTYEFKVEEFVPERLKVVAKPRIEQGGEFDTFGVNVEGRFLFGALAAGAEVQLKCSLMSSGFAPKDFADYRFGLAVPSNRPFDAGEAQGILDSQGMAAINCPSVEGLVDVRGPAKVQMAVSVLEAGSGRASVQTTSSAYFPEPFTVGLKSNVARAKSGQSVEVEGVLVDWQGALVAEDAEITLEFMQLEREYYWVDEDLFSSQWGQNLRAAVVESRAVRATNGRFKAQWVPKSAAAGVVIRAIYGKSQSELRLESDDTYSWWYWDSGTSQSGTPKPGRAKALALETEAEIEVGATSKARVQIPFAGRLLTTVETHKVLSSTWHTVSAGSFEWDFTVSEFEPTVYVSAFLVKDAGVDAADTFLPERAIGTATVRVKPSKHVLGVKVSAPETIAPNSTLKVTLTLADSSEKASVTVAAVDEGILQLTRYVVPDPVHAFFAKRRLGVGTYETIGWAMKMDPGGPTSRTGGGDDWDEESDQSGPQGRPQAIRPVSLWSGVVDVHNGKAEVLLNVPRYTGSLKVVAHAFTSQRSGFAQTQVIVRDPLVLQTTLPRFLSAGDTADIPVFVTNMTGRSGDVHVRLDVDEAPQGGKLSAEQVGGMLEVEEGLTRTLRLEDGAAGKVNFRVRALREAGVASVRVKASFGVIHSEDVGLIPFRPSGDLAREVSRISLQQGDNPILLKGWVPTSETTTVWITTNPYGESFSHLKYLVRYPYGCIEQTTSSTRPLLYIGSLVEMLDPEKVAQEGSVEDMAKSGINRILSMQTSDGGFAYWPGEQNSDGWGSVNAVHLLLDAEKAGFAVDPQALTRALSFVETQLHQDISVAAYGHYVLARAKRGQKALIQDALKRLPATPQGASSEQAYLLKAALYLSGDRRHESELKALDTRPVTTLRGYNYYSDLRYRAMTFSVFHDLFGRAPEGEAMADLIAQHLRGENMYTTQEVTWSLTGLGKWVKSDTTWTPPVLLADGKSLKATSGTSWNLYRASEMKNLMVRVGKLDGPLYAVIQSEGIRTGAAPRVGASGVRVSREIFNASGKALDMDSLKLGEVAFVVHTLTNISNQPLTHLALVDRLPAGFEVENPNLNRGGAVTFIEDEEKWATTHMNIRDDRVEVFGNLGRNASLKFVYTIRATSSGTFEYPAVQLEAMYDPAVWAQSAPARVTVKGSSK